MSKKSIYLMSFILILVFAANAPAVLKNWVGDDPNKWDVAGNWTPSGVPTSLDDAEVDTVDANCIIDSAAVCDELYLGRDNGPCYIYMMTGGTLTTTGYMYLGETDGTAIFNMSGGTVTCGNRLWVSEAQDSNGTLIMTGGEFNVTGTKVEIGKNSPDANGVVYMQGGLLNFLGPSCDVEIAKYGQGTVYITGGKINIDDNLKLGEGGGIGRVYLDGGKLNVGNDDLPIGANSFIDITEGTMVILGEDATDRITTLVGLGRIRAYGGTGGRVRIDYNDTDTTVTGFEADPNTAWITSPSMGATVEWTAAGPTITWEPGAYADSHDVYFGTDWDDVNDANNSGMWPEFIKNQDPCSYSPGTLTVGTTYYCRIDEVNALHPDTPWKGDISQFTMQDYIIVDDMDDYNDIAPDRIYYTWRDGWTITGSPGNDTGSQTGHFTISGTGFSEDEIVRSGLSMPFYYENDGAVTSKPYNIYTNSGLDYYSEATAKTTGQNSLDFTQDWTMETIKALSLWFYGDPNNSTTNAQMYVALEDGDNPSNTAVVNYSGNMSDIQEPEWHEWNIPLQSFVDNNDVNLANVQKIHIGFGDRYNPLAGTGCPLNGPFFIVYFDNIRLYPSRCLPDLAAPPEADIDGDCDVDYDDLDVMAEDWLDYDYTGVGNDGELMNFPNDNSQWVNDATRGRCLSFGGDDDWVDLDDREFSSFRNKTISLWVNIKEFPDPYPYIFCFQNYTSDPYRIYLRERGPNTVRARFVDTYSVDFNEVYPNTWHHLAFVLEDTGTNTCTGTFYGDANVIDVISGQPRHTGYAKGVNLGSFNDGTGPYINAYMDDFRVYDANLTANNIKYLAGKAGGVAPTANMLLHYKFDETTGQVADNNSVYVFNRPLLSAAELYDSESTGSRKINFKDFAILASDGWLDEPTYWP